MQKIILPLWVNCIPMLWWNLNHQSGSKWSHCQRYKIAYKKWRQERKSHPSQSPVLNKTRHKIKVQASVVAVLALRKITYTSTSNNKNPSQRQPYVPSANQFLIWTSMSTPSFNRTTHFQAKLPVNSVSIQRTWQSRWQAVARVLSTNCPWVNVRRKVWNLAISIFK